MMLNMHIRTLGGKYKIPVYTLVALALFNVQYASMVPLFDFGVNVVRVLLFFTFLFKLRKSLKANPAFICLFCIFVVELMSTLLFDGNIRSVIVRYLNILTAALWISLKKNEYGLLIPSIYFAASILVIANTISMILYPRGLYIGEDYARRWIIGQKQEFSYVFIIAVVLGAILWIENRYKLLYIINIIMMVYAIRTTLPLGLVIYFCVFTVTLICLIIPKKEIKAVTLLNINMVEMGLFIIFIYTATRFTGLFSLLSRIQASYSLTKADTFLVRIGIWRDAINIFSSSIIFGRGIIPSDNWSSVGRYSLYHPHFHNIYLDMLASGGIICFCLYIAMLYIVANRMDKNSTLIKKIFLASIFALNFLQLTECVYSCFVFGLFFFGYYIDEVKIEKKKRKIFFRRRR